MQIFDSYRKDCRKGLLMEGKGVTKKDANAKAV
jgi:hypothetical protein